MAQQRRVTKKPASATISREEKSGGESLFATHRTEDVLFDDGDCQHPAQVTVGASETINTGNFCSVKISTYVSIPCIPKESHINKAKAKAAELVQKYMDEEYAAATAPQG